MAADDALAGLQDELTGLMRRGRALARVFARAVDPRLDPTAYSMLVVLARSGGLRVSELGARLLLDKSTVSRQIDAAARLGLVERTVDPEDARARLVALTPLGRERVLSLLDEQRSRWRTALASWDREDVVRLTELLHKLGQAGIW